MSIYFHIIQNIKTTYNPGQHISSAYEPQAF